MKISNKKSYIKHKNKRDKKSKEYQKCEKSKIVVRKIGIVSENFDVGTRKRELTRKLELVEFNSDFCHKIFLNFLLKTFLVDGRKFQENTKNHK